jgi:hypothetical protein
MSDTVKINQPTPTQLTRLTILLAGHRPSFAGSTSRFILMGEAQKLWIMCAALLRSGFGLRPDEKFSKITVEEIATLAAILGHGANEKIRYETLARDALTLWIDCRRELDLMKRNAPLFGNPIKDYWLVANNPPGGKFPVPLNKALRRMMPQKRVPDRERFFRYYLKDEFLWKRASAAHGDVGSDIDNLTQDDAGKEIGRLRQNGFVLDEWAYHALNFPKWLGRYVKAQRQKIASTGGKAKAAKAAA